ncbi:MAG: BufA2 family periplasmic bufferin-type metallophore [Betaproteobacteria bacterium]
MDVRKRRAMKVLSGTALAATAAALFLSGAPGAVAADAKEAKVQCAGVNACKGKSDCATATSACMGQNACKGQGWLKMTEKQCLEKGGKVLKS